VSGLRAPRSPSRNSATETDQLTVLLEELLEDRPMPLRTYDQIHMRTEDLARHIWSVAPYLEGKDVLAMGDSDGFVLGLTCAGRLGLVPAPNHIFVCDFDRRVLQFIRMMTTRLGLARTVSLHAYNVFEPLPYELERVADVFHTNPPYGQYNGGRSVMAFVDRCLGGLRAGGTGLIIAANDSAFDWTDHVLRNILQDLLRRDVTSFRITCEQHRYHLDDQPELRSGVIWCRTPPRGVAEYARSRLPSQFEERFYGRKSIPIPSFIGLDGQPEQLTLDHGSA